MNARLVAVLALAAWLIGGLLFALTPAHPAPGQVVDHNFIPFRTIAIWVANPDSGFWIRQMVGNLLLLLPVGLLGPIALPWMDRWRRVLLAAFALSLAIELAQLWIPDRAADIDDLLLNVGGAALGYAGFTALRAGLGGRRPTAIPER
ncbi:MAG TPA: VanZ family protein [Candidatus Limnocylindria bacterium]